MVTADFGGDFLNVDSTKDGDIVAIVDKPYIGKLTFQGKEKQVTNIPVELNGKRLTYTPPNKAGRGFMIAWGEEMDNWVGKKFQVLHVDDKMVARPITAEKV